MTRITEPNSIPYPDSEPPPRDAIDAAKRLANASESRAQPVTLMVLESLQSQINEQRARIDVLIEHVAYLTERFNYEVESRTGRMPPVANKGEPK